MLVAANQRENCKDHARKVTALSLGGEIRYLDRKNVPSIPTLIVAKSETRGEYPESKPKTESMTSFYTTLKEQSTNMLLVEDPPPIEYKFKIKECKIGLNYDWPEGNNEVYFKVYYWGSWHETNVFPNIVQDTWFFPGLIYSFTDPSTAILIDIWEDDGWGSGEDDFVADGWWYQRELRYDGLPSLRGAGKNGSITSRPMRYRPN